MTIFPNHKKRFALLCVLLVCTLAFWQHTEVTLEDAQNITGSKNFKTLNNLQFTSQFSGATADVQISNAIAALTGGNGIVYADYTSTQNLAACPTFGSGNVQLVLYPATYTVAVNCTIPSNVIVQFANGAILSPNISTTTTLTNAPKAQPTQQIFSGSGSIIINQSPMYHLWFAGSDAGAKINAAVLACPSNCAIYVVDNPANGQWSYSTPINLAAGSGNGIRLAGFGTGATILNYTGSTASTALSVGVTTNSYIENLQLTTSNVTGIGIFVGGTNNIIHSVVVNGFGTGINVAGSGTPSFVRAFKTRILNTTVTNYGTTGIQIDHAIDTYLEFDSVYAANNNATTTQLLIETGVSGLYVTNFAGGYGLNGLRVQKVLNDGGASAAYNAAPLYLKFVMSFFDTTPGGDACKFDATLSNSVINAEFVASWCSAAGMNNVPAVVTAGAINVNILGGTGYKFTGGTYRFAACSGFNINSANTNQIEIVAADIMANNQNNGADCHGIYIQSASPNIGIVGNKIGNVLDAGGHQKFGIKVSAVNADILRILDNNLANNETGVLSNSNTGNTWIWGNAPMAGPTGNIVWGNILMTNTLQMNNQAITGINTMTPNTAGTGDIGSTSLPFPNLWIGAAATNNIKLTGTATAARVATLQDQTGTVELITCTTSQKAESAADANVLTCTPLAQAGSYRLRFVLSLSAANTATLGWTATWTDSNGNAQTPTNLSLFQSGTAAPALTFTTSAAGNYYGETQIDINNAATNIVIKLTFAGTSFAGKASATVERII